MTNTTPKTLIGSKLNLSQTQIALSIIYSAAKGSRHLGEQKI